MIGVTNTHNNKTNLNFKERIDESLNPELSQKKIESANFLKIEKVITNFEKIRKKRQNKIEMNDSAQECAKVDSTDSEISFSDLEGQNNIIPEELMFEALQKDCDEIKNEDSSHEKSEEDNEYVYQNEEGDIEVISMIGGESQEYSYMDLEGGKQHYTMKNIVPKKEEKRKINPINKREWSDHLKIEDIKKGKFSREEIKAIVKAIIRYAYRHKFSYEQLIKLILEKKKRNNNPIWTEISISLPKRSVQSINHMCHRLFSPFNNKGVWNREDEEKLIKLYEILGSRWKKIGELLERSSENVKDKWKNMHLKGKIKHKLLNLNETLELLSYANKYFFEEFNNNIFKYNFKFSKKFKFKELDGDRYLDKGEKCLLLDKRIQHFSQKDFIFQILKLLINVKHLKILYLKNAFSDEKIFGLVKMIKDEAITEKDVEETKYRLFEILKNLGIYLPKEVFDKFQLVLKFFNCEENINSLTEFDLKDIKDVLESYEVKFTENLTYSEKIRIIVRDVLDNFNKSILSTQFMEFDYKEEYINNIQDHTNEMIIENISNSAPKDIICESKILNSYINYDVNKSNMLKKKKMRPLKMNLKDLYDIYFNSKNRLTNLNNNLNNIKNLI